MCCFIKSQCENWLSSVLEYDLIKQHNLKNYKNNSSDSTQTTIHSWTNICSLLKSLYFVMMEIMELIVRVEILNCKYTVDVDWCMYWCGTIINRCHVMITLIGWLNYYNFLFYTKRLIADSFCSRHKLSFGNIVIWCTISSSIWS